MCKETNNNTQDKNAIISFIKECIQELRKANPSNAEFNGQCSSAIFWLEDQENNIWHNTNDDLLPSCKEVFIKRITASEAHADADKVNQKRLADEQDLVYKAIFEAKKSGEYSATVDLFISDELLAQLTEDGFYVNRRQYDGYKQYAETIIKF